MASSFEEVPFLKSFFAYPVLVKYGKVISWASLLGFFFSFFVNGILLWKSGVFGHFGWSLILVEHVTVIPDAGSRIEFPPGKSLRFSKLFLGILLSDFRFTVFLPLGCGVDSWRVSWRATTDSLLSWRATRGIVKSWEFEGQIRWKEFCPFHEITGFTFQKSLRIRILREFG